MRLLSRTLLLTLGVFALGCSDSTGPTLNERVYILYSINGQPLPAVLSPIPEATVSVLSATLFFNAEGKVLWTERRREVENNVPHEVTYTSTLDYQRSGNSVVIRAVCSANANCVSFEGTLTEFGLNLTVGWFSPTTPIIYEYAEGAMLD